MSRIPHQTWWPLLGATRAIHRANSELFDQLPASLISWLNRRPGADVLLIAPRTARAVIDAQHPDRPRAARVPLVTARTVAEAAADELILGLLKGTHVAERADFLPAVELGKAEADRSRTPETFCPSPPAPRAVPQIGDVRLRKNVAEHLTFPSRFDPPPGLCEPEAWAQHHANATVHLFLLRHEPDAPWLINVHGVKQGRPADMLLFRSAGTRERFGVNVLHPVLPMTGLRAGWNSPAIPGTDHTANVLALAQAAWDVRRAIRWIRESSDAPIILHGVSLGAYVVSLVASLEDGLAGVIAGLPVADYPALMRRHARRMDLTDEELELVDRPELDSLYGPVSPLVHPSKVPGSRRFVYAGKLDQISSSHQARALWEHWGECSIHWFGGGHLGGALWDRSVKRYIDDALESTLRTVTRSVPDRLSA